MQRHTIPVSLTVQFPNEVQPPQWDAPVLMMHASVVTNAAGQVAYPPAFTQVPAAESDITEEVLAVLSRQFSAIGLTLTRVKTDAA